MEIKKVKLSALRLNPDNPRIIKDDKFKKLVKSILTFPKMLELREIVTDEAMMVLGGNMRLRALQHIAKMTEQELRQQLKSYDREELTDYWIAWHDCPMETVKIGIGLTDAEKEEFIDKDNLAYGEWDWESLANRYDIEVLQDWGHDVPVDWGNDTESKEMEKEAEEDDFDEEKDAVEPICQRGDIWMLGQHTLMCGDSTSEEDVARLTGGEKMDLWLTDPPYNVNYSSKNQYLNKMRKGNCVQKDIESDNMSDDEFCAFLEKAFKEAEKSMKNGAAFYVWTAQGHALVNIFASLDKIGLHFRQQIIWTKNNIVLGRMDYQCKHEPCFYGWKGGATHFFKNTRSEATVIPDAHEINIKKMKKEEMAKLLEQIFSEAIPTSIIREDKPQKNEYHPTMKPIKLFGRLIINSSRQGERVLDTFGGSGTTLIACEQLDRKCYMMELDPHYCDVIIARWEKLTGNKAIKKQ